MKGKTIRVRAFGICAILAILVLGVTSCPAPPPETAPPSEVPKTSYKLGALIPLTGGVAQDGPGERAACEVAVEKINEEGGILGRPVELIVADNASEAETAARATKRLILQDEIEALIGTIPGPATHAAAAICEEYGIPMLMSPGAPDDIITDRLNPWFFSIGQSYYMQANGLAKENERLATEIQAATGKKSVKFVTVAVDYSWGYESVKFFKEFAEDWSVPVEFVGEYWIPLEETSFSSYVTAMKADNPDIVNTWIYGTALLNFLNEAKGYGLLDKMTLTCWGEGESIIAAGKAMPDGIRIQSDCEWWALDLPQFQGYGWDEFSKAYVAKMGTPPTIIGIEDYDSCMCLFEAIRRCNSFDRDKIAAELEGGTFKTLRGELYIRAIDHQMNVPTFFGYTAFDPDLGFCTAYDVKMYPGEECWYSEEEILARRQKS